jgi:hypothetical protein
MDGDVEVVVPPADAATDPSAFLKWDQAFWDESDAAGQDLIKADLLIEQEIAILEGHYEAGKTAIMTDVERQWIEMGRPVLHLDYEMGKRRMRSRMKANRWGPAHLELWHYLYMPTLEPGFLAQLMALVPEHPLIAVDSYSQAMMFLNREENSATEAGNFWVSELQGARESGATVLVIDQVKQNATARDRYAGRGTGAKSFGADVKWFVERYEKFTPTQSGLVKLTLQKDREGVLPEALGFVVGDGEGHLTVSRTEPPKGTPIDEQAIESIVAVIEVEGWLTPTGVKQRTEGYGDATIRSTLQYLEGKGVLRSRPRVGKGGGTEYNKVDGDIADDTPSLD